MTDGIDKVINSGLCVGCGGCAFAAGGRMETDEFGFFRPELPADTIATSESRLAQACPFLAPELDEDALADRFLPPAPNRNHKIGKFFEVFAAHVEESDFRRAGSSGGMGSWISSELLKEGLIDGVIHVKPSGRQAVEDPFFRYGISRSVEEIREAAHSHYHVVEVSEVLAEVKRAPGRYLFIGIPCMVKAVRRAQAADSDLAERICFTMALVCGHLKSVHWAVSLGWAAGLEPEDIGAITFRVKSENVPAKAYYFEVESQATGKKIVEDSAPITGGKFNLGAMMPEACNYCDDVVGETADLTIGDAWLPRYSFDWRGKNMVISRNEHLASVIHAAHADGRIQIDPITPSEAADAQAGGFRQRREGLAHRLAKDKAAGRWAPQKRALPDMKRPGFLRAHIYNLRAELSRRSRVAFRKALDARDLDLYDNEMKSVFKRLRIMELSAVVFRILSIRLRALFFRGRT